MKALLAAALVLGLAAPAAAQVDGYVSLMAIFFPDVAAEDGTQDLPELRARVFVEHARSLGEHFRYHLSGYVDGLAADRRPFGGVRTKEAIARPGDLYVEILTPHFDLRLGASRLVWGRLDEFQPTDVVNPIDLSRFLLEGRTEARLPVGLARARFHMPASTTLEVVAVPVFRASRFDQLDEPSSPFNVSAVPGAFVERQEPPRSRRSFQGGARLTSTAGRVDWGVSGFRGIRTFPTVTLLQTFAPPPVLLETFPRYTMAGADFETVRGPWGVRGEAAYFVTDTIQVTDGNPRGVEGRSAEAGIGADRRAGSYRVAGNVLWSWNSLDGWNYSVVGAMDRSFARETRTLRLFGVYNPENDTLFARVIAAISFTDNVWLEGSGGLFTGTALDVLGRLSRRDFIYTRLKIYL